MIFDTHTHLNSDELYEIRKEVIQRAKDSGVGRFVVVGYDIESSKKAIEVANEFPGVCYAAIGLHPSEIEKCKNDPIEELLNLAQNKCVIAIGEIGLDYHWDDVPREKQKDFFVKQIKLAYRLNLPIIIHTRDAAKDTIDILKNEKMYLKNQGIIHCYSGSKENVKDYIDLGFYIAFGGALTFKNAVTPKEAIAAVPLDKLLFETDCPYLTPHPYRGKQNEPMYINLVVDEACKILNIEKERLVQITESNALKVFRL